jgi:predicted dehydrogenase
LIKLSLKKMHDNCDQNLRIKYGVAQIGYGTLGKAILKAMGKNIQFETVAIFDENLENIKQPIEPPLKKSPYLARSLGDALNRPNIDIVFVNTPAETHFEICTTALEHGKHVHCAKPLTLDAEQARFLIEKAKAKHLSVTVGHQIKYNSHFQFLSAIIRSQILGELLSLTFINNKRRPEPGNLKFQKNPILWEMSTHHLDTLFYLFPELTFNLRGSSLTKPSWSAYDSATCVNAIFESNTGVSLLYQASFDTARSNYFFRIEGKKAVLDILGDHISLPVSHHLISRRDGTSQVLKVPSRRQDAWRKIFDQIAFELNNGEQSEINAVANLRVIEQIEKIELNAV